LHHQHTHAAPNPIGHGVEIKERVTRADEGRLAHDGPAIGYDWTAGPEIK
jgi:hypothetical protein